MKPSLDRLEEVVSYVKGTLIGRTLCLQIFAFIE